MFPFFSNEFNNETRQSLKKLATDIENHPMFSQFKAVYDEVEASPGISLLLVRKTDNKPFNKFIFFADRYTGNVSSIAIYGRNLQGHYNTINSSKNIFGYSVKNISIETQNTREPFIDIYL